jgi:hypothetical protein
MFDVHSSVSRQNHFSVLFPAGHLNSSDAHAGHAMIFEVAMMTNQVLLI